MPPFIGAEEAGDGRSGVGCAAAIFKIPVIVRMIEGETGGMGAGLRGGLNARGGVREREGIAEI